MVSGNQGNKIDQVRAPLACGRRRVAVLVRSTHRLPDDFDGFQHCPTWFALGISARAAQIVFYSVVEAAGGVGCGWPSVISDACIAQLKPN